MLFNKAGQDWLDWTHLACSDDFAHDLQHPVILSPSILVRTVVAEMHALLLYFVGNTSTTEQLLIHTKTYQQHAGLHAVTSREFAKEAEPQQSKPYVLEEM